MHRSYRGMEFQSNNVIKKKLLTRAKLYVNSLDASGVIKSFFSFQGTGVYAPCTLKGFTASLLYVRADVNMCRWEWKWKVVPNESWCWWRQVEALKSFGS